MNGEAIPAVNEAKLNWTAGPVLQLALWTMTLFLQNQTLSICTGRKIQSCKTCETNKLSKRGTYAVIIMDVLVQKSA
jgi:hypothetical protein